MNNILRDAKRVKTNVNRAKSLVPVGKEKDGGEKVLKLQSVEEKLKVNL